MEIDNMTNAMLKVLLETLAELILEKTKCKEAADILIKTAKSLK